MQKWHVCLCIRELALFLWLETWGSVILYSFHATACLWAFWIRWQPLQNNFPFVQDSILPVITATVWLRHCACGILFIFLSLYCERKIYICERTNSIKRDITSPTVCVNVQRLINKFPNFKCVGCPRTFFHRCRKTDGYKNMHRYINKNSSPSEWILLYNQLKWKSSTLLDHPYTPPTPLPIHIHLSAQGAVLL